MYHDENGLIVQRDMDGGDSAGREGDYWFAKALIDPRSDLMFVTNKELTFSEVLTLLQVSPGVFVRNPRHNPTTPPDKSWNDPTDFSRDQATPLIIAMGANKEYKVLRSMLWQQIKRFTLFQNKDLAGPQDWGHYIRAFNAWYLYPILLVGDIFMLTNSVIRCIVGNDENTSDDINHTISLLQAQHSLPTPISWLSRKIYKWFRKGGVQNAWDHYFKPESGANPFNEIFNKLISEM